MTSQQEICLKCGWCCQHEVFKVPDGALELYWVRGHDLFYDPKLQHWFVVVEQCCKCYDGTKCMIYDNRPQADIDWMCPYPDGSIWEKIKIFKKAAQRILKIKYGEMICQKK